tara:strand:- start:7125 stop:7415 length:291 start_codon:yes stop_codon:yes gene_type:complete
MKDTEILLNNSDDLFGLKKSQIFKHHSEDWNIAKLRVKNPIGLEMDQSRFYTDVKLFMSDDIEQLEKLAAWSKALTKNVNSHVKKLKAKQEVKEEV